MLSTNYEAVRARIRRETKTEEVRAYHREWARANRDKVRSYEANVDPAIRREKARLRMAAWRNANPEKAKATSPESAKKRIEYGKKYRQENPTAVREWKRANPERAKALAKRYTEKNREAIRARGRKYATANRERILEYGKQWRKENPTFHQVAEQKRRAQKRTSGGNGVTHAQWLDLITQYGGRCAYCSDIQALEMEHVEPLSKGGIHDITNVVPSCASCNRKKHDDNIIVWLASRAIA